MCAGVVKVSVVILLHICEISHSVPDGARDQLAYFSARPPLVAHSSEVKVAQSCPALCDPMIIQLMEFSLGQNTEWVSIVGPAGITR